MLAGDSLLSDEGLAHNSASVVLLQTDEDGSAWSQDANAQNVAEFDSEIEMFKTLQA